MVGLRRPPEVEAPAEPPPAPTPPARPRTGRWRQILAMGAIALVGLGAPWAIGPEPMLQAPPRPAPVFKSDLSPPPASEEPSVSDTDAADMHGFVPTLLLPPAVEPALPPPVVAPLPPDQQAWRRNAVAVADPRGRPMIAIVIDDLGLDRRNADRVVQLPGPLTLSFMTYAEDLAVQTHAAHAAGHELLVHVPMQPLDDDLSPGPNVLRPELPPGELLRRIDWALGRFDGYVGINNHMGSRFTADASGMALLFMELHRRGLLFLDSRTTPATVGDAMAARYDVAFAGRNIFLDNETAADAVWAQLTKTEADARRAGFAVAIGHPHDGTIAALAQWLPTLRLRGFALVPISRIVERNLAARGEAVSYRGVGPGADIAPTASSFR
jgi:polysaccharide deacetylase 2 family uncharacterized protein YibQ